MRRGVRRGGAGGAAGCQNWADGLVLEEAREVRDRRPVEERRERQGRAQVRGDAPEEARHHDGRDAGRHERRVLVDGRAEEVETNEEVKAAAAENNRSQTAPAEEPKAAEPAAEEESAPADAAPVQEDSAPAEADVAEAAKEEPAAPEEENKVVEAIHLIAEPKGYNQEQLTDLACLALNNLPTRYYRHEVDLAFYMSAQEHIEINQRVEKAVRSAIAYLEKNKK